MSAVIITDTHPGLDTLWSSDLDQAADVMVRTSLRLTTADLESMADVTDALVLTSRSAAPGKALAAELAGMGVSATARHKGRWATTLGDKGTVTLPGGSVVATSAPAGSTPRKQAAKAETSLAAKAGKAKGKAAKFPGTAAKVWNAADMAPPGKVEWLAHHRLPKAATSLLVGAEGIGKSALTVALVAAVTTGRPLEWFGLPAGEPMDVVLVLTEDDWSIVASPRLLAAGADMSRIHIICEDADGSGPPAFPGDEHKVIEMDPAPGLIIVDAWLDTVPNTLSVRDAQQARVALAPWKGIATKTRAACLLVTHTNRLATGNVRDTYGGTSELRKAARMTLYALQDDDGHLVVGPEKANFCQPENAVVLERYDTGDDVVRLRFLRDSGRLVGEYVMEAASTGAKEGRSEAATWLHDYLAENGPTARKDVIAAGAEEGYSERTLTRSLKSAGGVSTRSGFGATSTWSLGGRILDLPAASSTDDQEEG